ncbi:MAG: NAD-dependent epimerase [Omnitrophica WOR_2 bacterium GWF2_38_59]|nr:MAG: NAD-dependent epimerase [Omnitrophica WOR_2 bacterium GWF2_38_59]OGX48262.1 MAG: NAD-dependent epimerase [Omnitrophica WOR_2 bacterium RIFOXYA2_FULL_38_17]OGX59573.1 MAG: NAD-dependent epimerase [Omnitrophica WOR_2 bacterium RIFOXYC2_FULL_38_12]OGX59965.1 MAG: NAD-dependent epimerase [Omnitrophica WOR_2 bacterium RIFOXYB2_FULL_38_16]
MSKKVMVFGGSGFLGSHVADCLVEKGYDVSIYDIKKSSYLTEGQKMIVGDVTDYDKVIEVLKGFDIVYNFSGIADIQEASENPLNVVKLNILGNTNILEACRINKVKRFIFASSLYVYGNLGSFYRSSKQACELIIEDYQKKFGLDFIILRYGSLYGDRATGFNPLRDFIEQAIKKGKIIRKGNGEEIREYINVVDAARSSVEVIERGFKNEYMMISGNQSMKIKDMLEMIKEMMKGKIKIEYNTPALADEHYGITPYYFQPKVAKKYVLDSYYDLGEGILSLIYKTHEELLNERENGY